MNLKEGDEVIDLQSKMQGILIAIRADSCLISTNDTGMIRAVKHELVCKVPQPGDRIQFDFRDYDNNYTIKKFGWFLKRNHDGKSIITELDLPTSDLHDQIVDFVIPIERSDIVWALWRMFFKAKMRRKGWREDVWTSFGDGGLLTFKGGLYINEVDQFGEFELGMIDLLTHDWEVFSGANEAKT